MRLVSAELDHINNANCIQFWLQTPSKQQTPEQYRDHSSPKFIKNGLVVSEDHLRDGQMDRDEHSSIKSPDTQQRSASSIMWFREILRMNSVPAVLFKIKQVLVHVWSYLCMKLYK